jgi:uncharacterized membrane protein
MRRSVAKWSAGLVLLASACSPPTALDDASSPAIPARFTALGTEPFWAAEVEGDTLLYKTPEDQEGRRVALTRRTLAGRAELNGALADEPMVLRVFAGPCSDGMSDTVYPYSAEMRLGRQRMNGCAKPR